jgi:hypothetical protein
LTTIQGGHDGANFCTKEHWRRSGGTTAAVAGGVLLILGAAQFLMILDTSVMNVSIATVAEDVGTNTLSFVLVGAILLLPTAKRLGARVQASAPVAAPAANRVKPD